MGQSESMKTPVTSSRAITRASSTYPLRADISGTPSSPTQNLVQHQGHHEVVSLLKSIVTKFNELQQSMCHIKDDVGTNNCKIATCENYLKELTEHKYHERLEGQDFLTVSRRRSNEILLVNDIHMRITKLKTANLM